MTPAVARLPFFEGILPPRTQLVAQNPVGRARFTLVAVRKSKKGMKKSCEVLDVGYWKGSSETRRSAVGTDSRE